MRTAQVDQRAVVAAFAPDGLHAVTMDEVSRRAGVAKPTLYRKFPSKEELFAACVEAECERLLERLFAAYGRHFGREPAQRLAAVILAVFLYAREEPASFRLLFVTARHTASSVAERVDASLRRVEDQVADVLRRELGLTDACREEAQTLAAGLLGMSTALGERCAQMQEQALRSTAARTAAMLVDGWKAAPVVG